MAVGGGARDAGAVPYLPQSQSVDPLFFNQPNAFPDEGFPKVAVVISAPHKQILA